jgi:hypothetical protein
VFYHFSDDIRGDGGDVCAESCGFNHMDRVSDACDNDFGFNIVIVEDGHDFFNELHSFLAVVIESSYEGADEGRACFCCEE